MFSAATLVSWWASQPPHLHPRPAQLPPSRRLDLVGAVRLLFAVARLAPASATGGCAMLLCALWSGAARARVSPRFVSRPRPRVGCGGEDVARAHVGLYAGWLGVATRSRWPSAFRPWTGTPLLPPGRRHRRAVRRCAPHLGVRRAGGSFFSLGDVLL